MLPLFPENIHLELLHPVDKTPTGLTLELVGTDNDVVYEAIVNVLKSLRLKGEKEISDFTNALDTKIKIASTCIVGWTNTSEDWKQIFTKLGFADDVYSAEKALKLIAMPTASWIRAQIEAAVADKERFFKSASSA
jgi:hypothetical protein